MKVIEPVTITDAEFVDSNIATTAHPMWDGATTYSNGQRIYKAAVAGRSYRTVYESQVASNTGNDPATDDGTRWLEIGATDRFKAFDRKIANTVSRASSITYSIAPPSLITGIALFGLDAESVRVQIYDAGGALVFDQLKSLVDTTEIVDWFSFCTWAADYDSEAMFIGIPGYSGHQIDITISAPTGTASVGQIVLGQVHALGSTQDGTGLGIDDYSTKDRDDFGNALLIERAFAQTVNFQFHMPTRDARRVHRILSRLRATPSVYFAAEDMTDYGTTVFGFFQDFDIPLSASGTSYATLQIEGLV